MGWLRVVLRAVEWGERVACWYSESGGRSCNAVMLPLHRCVRLRMRDIVGSAAWARFLCCFRGLPGTRYISIARLVVLPVAVLVQKY